MEKPSELDTTCSQQKHRYERTEPRITSELDGDLVPVEAGATATFSRYAALLRQPQELASAEKSDFAGPDRYSNPEQFVDYSRSIEQESSPIGRSEF